MQYTDFNWIFQIAFLVIFMYIYLYGQRLQTYIWTRNVEAGVKQLEALAHQGKKIAHNIFWELGIKEEDIKATFEDFPEFFVIEPVSVDPAGVLGRLENLLDVPTNRYEKYIQKIAPYATEEEVAQAENVLAGVMALHYVYRVANHFLTMGKKTKSIYWVMQLQMQLPMIIQMAKGYFESLRAFAEGFPIGDGIGPLAVAHFAWDIGATPPEEITKNTITQEGEFEGRIIYFVRARGLSASVGKPGSAIKLLVDFHKKSITRIITIAAGLKLENEETGHVIEGVGAAIGDPGPEKFKMEETAVHYEIPIDAIIIKESLEEALSPMKQCLVKAVPKVIQKLENAILQRTKKGDSIIIAGIGNTSGIA